MSNNNDLWKHLKDSGIESCCENDEIEIENHDERSVIDIVHSYYFDCLKFTNGIQFSMVFVRVTNNGEFQVDPNEIIFDLTPGLGAQAQIDGLISQLKTCLKSFIQNRGELI